MLANGQAAETKLTSAEAAVAAIRTGDTVCFSGFVGIGTPEEIIRALADRFDRTGEPRDLTLVFAAAPGDGGERGLNRLAKPGLVKAAIGGHWALVPKLAAMAVNDEIEAYNLPLGCMSQLFREIAGRRPGLLSRVGRHTFVDPRQTGGSINAISQRKLVELQVLAGEEWLFYRSFPIHVAIIRASSTDSRGNATMEREALTLDALAMAMAAKAHGGRVIVQTEAIAPCASLNSRQIVLPGIVVDDVVLANPDNHHQTFATAYSPAFSGEARTATEDRALLPLDERKIIARRAALELPPGGVVNLGIGMPEGVAAVADEEGMLGRVTLTAEPGVIGGIPQGGLDFGAAVNAEAIIHQNQQFDFYDGGGLDMACLGMAQIDCTGNVNVSRFGTRLAGAGGFINISQNARKVVFVGTFTAQGLQIEVRNGQMRIAREGQQRKFLRAVEQITFNGRFAAASDQSILYVTERCVFDLTAEGLRLIEIAPGIDLERDILDQMEVRPQIGALRPMDPRIFAPAVMGPC